MIEMLEQRRLHSSVLLSVGGLLRVNGDENANKIALTIEGERIRIRIDKLSRSFNRVNIRSIDILGGKSGDVVNVDRNIKIPTTISGDEGQDTLFAGSAETMIVTDAQDAIIPVSGNRIQYAFEPGVVARNFSLVVDDADGLVNVGAFVNFEDGSSGPGGFTYVPDLTIGFTSNADHIDCQSLLSLKLDLGGGADSIDLNGDGQLTPPLNQEIVVMGGNGDDRIFAERIGRFVLSGGRGNDVLIPSADAQNIITGNAGTDTVDYSARTKDIRVTLDGKANDGEAGEHDNVGADVERILGGSGNDYLQGGPFDEYLAGNAGDDTLWGGAGDDTLAGGGGRDWLHGQAGDDQLQARHGSTDTLDGGDGNDAASYDVGIDSVKEIETFI